MRNKSLRNLIFVFITVFVLSFVALAQFSPNMIVRNNDSLIVDNNGDQLADPNDVIQYTVVVANCGDGTAENVEYQSQIDPNTQLNPDSVVVNDLEAVDSSLCPQTADTSTNNDTPVEETPVPTVAPVIVDADAVDDAFNVTNGATNTENILDNDLGTNARVLSFGDSAANVGDTPADGSNVLSIPAGGGTIDITIDANGDLIITSNGSTGTGTVTIFYEIEAENGTTNIGQISITYGDFPTATDDTLATLGAGNEYATNIGVTLNIPAGTGLLTNDTLGNPAGTLTLWGGGDASATVTLTPASSTPLAGGTLTVNADGSFDLVTPTSAGVYTFSYILDNGLGTSQGSVEIYVNAPADAIDDAISVTNGGTNTGNIITNDLGTAPLTALSFGDSVANVGTTPADGTTILSLPAGGGTLDVTIDSNGDLSVTANGTTGTGTVTIYYEIEAGNGTTDIAEIAITFGDFPTAIDDTLATLGAGNEYDVNAGSTLIIGAGIGLLNNDILGNPAGTLTLWGGGDASATVTLTPASSTPFAGGTLTVDADGAFTINSPTTTGTYTFDYILDNGLGTSQGSVEIYVVAPPVAVVDSFTVTLGAVDNSNNVVTNDDSGAPSAVVDFYADTGDIGGASQVASPNTYTHPTGNFTITITPAGILTVDATGGTVVSGTYTFDYQITNSSGSSVATVTIIIAERPITEDDAFTLIVGNNLAGDVTADNGSGADDAGTPAFTSLTFGDGDLGGTVTSNNGGASVALAGGTLSLSNAGAITLNGATTAGTYSFDYQLTNANGTSNVSTITIEIQEAPTAEDDALTATLNIVNNYPAPALFNDNGSGADDLGTPTATLASFGGGSLAGDASSNLAGTTVAFAGGNLTVNADGSLTVSNPTATGTFTLEYRLTNVAGSSDATLTINVTSVPTAQDDAYTFLASVNQNIVAGAGLFVDNGSGVDTLGTPTATLTSFGGGDLGGTVTTNTVGASVALAGGSLTVNADGSWSLTGQPFTAGTYTFDYRLTNSQGTSDASVTFTIQDTPTAEDDTLTATLNIVNNYPASTLFNDNGSGADDLGTPTATLASFGGGSLAGDASSNLAGATVAFAGGNLTINADGSLTVSNPTATGTFTLEYRLTNVAGSSDATVTINVTSVPTAQDDAYTFLASVNQNIVAGAGLFVDNGSGADTLGTPTATLTSFGGGDLGGTVTTNTVGASVALAGGSLTVNADGSWSLTGQPFTAGTYTFDYRLTNSQGTSDATVTFTIQEAPTAEDDALTATLNIVNNYPASTLFNDNGSGTDDLGTPTATIASFGGGSLAGDASSNLAGATVAFAGGNLTINADGSLTVSNPTATGTFTLDYRLTNVAGSSDATITITLNAIPDGVDDSSATVLAETSAPNDNDFHLPMNSASTGVVNVYNDNNFGADNLGVPSAPSDAPTDAINTVLLNGVADAGTGTIGGGAFTIGTTGSLEITTTGLVNLTPPTGFVGTIEFDYTLANSVGTDATPATVIYAFGARSACVADGYDATGNIGIDTTNGTNQSVLFNDNGDGFTLSAVQGAAGNIATNTATAQSGTVNMTANGEFSYTPPAGFTGDDTFTYTINNGFNQASQCTVTITVSNMVYFMDSSASAGGNGTLARPYQSIAEHNGASPIANSSLFIKDNGSAYAGNLTLVSGQRVIGEGTTGTLFGAGSLTSITLAPLSVTMPYSTNGTVTSWAQIINPVGDGITLNINNNLSGLSIGNTSGTGLSGTSINTLTVNEMEIIGTGNVMSLDMGTTLDITFTTLSTTNASGHAIFVSGFGGNFTATTTNLTGVSGNGIYIITSSGTVNLGATTVNSVGNSVWLQNANASASFTIDNVGGLTTTNATALSAGNYDGQITVTGVGGLSGVSACIQIVGNPSTTINVDVENCIASASSAYGLRLANVTGTGLIVRNATNITQTGGISPAIQIFNSSATLIDISDNSTITITNRRNRGIEVDIVSSTVNFGTTTINNPNVTTEPAVYLSDVTATIDFDELNANQGGAGAGETYTVNVPNDNDGLGDVVYANNVTALTLNGGTLSNTGDDGIDFRNSGALTLNNIVISLVDGRNRSNGIQAYNSDSVTMTGGSINDFAGTGVISGGAEPWGAFIYHDNTYTGASSTNIFDSVDFDGGTGTNGSAIVFLNEDNTVSNLIVRNGSTFINTDELSIWSLNNGSGTTSTTITNNVFGTPLANGSTGVYISDAPASTGAVEFNINNNIFDDIGDNSGGAILISLLDGADARTQTNQINNNTITEVDGSPAQAGIFINMAETSGLNLEANNNIITGFSEYALLLFTGGWTSGEIDLSMTNNTLSATGLRPVFEVSDAGNMGSTGNIQILFDDVTINAPNGIAAELETYSSRIDWVTTNSIFSSSSPPSIFVLAENVGTICLDFNDDGGGQNTTNNGFLFLEAAGTLLLENGTTAAAVIADNSGMNNGTPTVVGATQADCVDATP